MWDDAFFLSLSLCFVWYFFLMGIHIGSLLGDAASANGIHGSAYSHFLFISTSAFSVLCGVGYVWGKIGGLVFKLY